MDTHVGITPNFTELAKLRARIGELEAALAAERARAEALLAERDRLRAAYEAARVELELLRRRIYVASAERVDTTALQQEFASKAKELETLSKRLEAMPPPATDVPAEATEGGPPVVNCGRPTGRAKPKGRRNFRALPLAEERCEIRDPALEGYAELIGFEESVTLGWRKAGPVRFVVARAKYKFIDDQDQTKFVVAAKPPQAFARCAADGSLLAKIATDKFCDGLPLHRQEDRFCREGLRLDRGTMCRWMENLGMTLGATIVTAMRKEALEESFCIATDATGVAILPLPTQPPKSRPCRRGHFFVLLADRDHVLFEYMPRENGPAIAQMLRGYSGYVQADAKSVYDILFRPPKAPDDEVCIEVACWAHARRGFYEAAITKSPLAREALFRIQRLFANEEQWTDLPPERRLALRQRHSKPELDDFFAWADIEYEKVKKQRGLLRSAFGYVLRQREALCRYLEDGRLRMDNNPSESALRRIVLGQNAFLFFGSDDHAEAAANLYSVIASCRLHGLDPEAYLRDVIRLLPLWPSDRYLELAPKYWAATKSRLDPVELAKPAGLLAIPPPLPTTAQQPSAC